MRVWRTVQRGGRAILSDAETRRYRGARRAFFPAQLLRRAEIGLIIGIEPGDIAKVRLDYGGRIEALFPRGITVKIF